MMANMQEIQGMLAIDELKLRVSEGTIDTVIVAFTDHYGRLMGKRYDATFFLEDTVTGGSHACDYLLTVDRDMNPLPGFRFANWERGYGDVHLVPDMSTLRTVSWLDRTALVICDVHPSGGHELLPIAPRSILRHQVQRAAASKFTAMAATELEFYMFRDSFEEACAQGARRPEAHRLVHRGLPHLAGNSWRGLRRRPEATSGQLGCTRGELQG